MTTKTVLGPKGTSQPPYGSFAGKSPFTPADSKNFVRNFTVLGIGGYSRPLWGSFAGKVQQVVVPDGGTRGSATVLTDRRGVGAPGFTRREYDEFLAAKRAALAKAKKLKKKAEAEELREAVAIASHVAGLLGDFSPSLEPVTEALRAAATADAADAMQAAIAAVNAAQALLRRIEEDEDDDEMLLLSI